MHLKSILRVAAAAITGIAAAALLAFIGLPLLGIFLHVPLGTLVAQLHSQVALDALRVSLKTSLVALAFIVIVGTPVAQLLATKTFPGRVLLVTLFELPLVLPPAVAGIGLLMAFGRFGLLGTPLQRFGIFLPFTWVAVVMAQAFVAMPFYVRQAIAAFASVDSQLLAASRTLGASPSSTFLRVAVPLARQSLSAGPHWHGRARSASSARRRSSPAPSRASRRRCRWPSTSSSPTTSSLSVWQWRLCSWP